MIFGEKLRGKESLVVVEQGWQEEWGCRWLKQSPLQDLRFKSRGEQGTAAGHHAPAGMFALDSTIFLTCCQHLGIGTILQRSRILASLEKNSENPAQMGVKFSRGNFLAMPVPYTWAVLTHLGSFLDFASPDPFKRILSMTVNLIAANDWALLAWCLSFGLLFCPLGRRGSVSMGPSSYGTQWPVTCSFRLGCQSQLLWKFQSKLIFVFLCKARWGLVA